MWYHILIVVTLVILAGIYAGLTLALFGIKLTTLERRIKIGDEKAKKVYEIRKRGYLLLCSLLLGNVASYTIMAIYLGSLTSGVVASIVATALIFIFGEIIPQAVFPRFALQIGAKLAPLVKATIVICYPVAAPMAWLLNKLIGHEEPVLWSKRELGEIIKYHVNFGDGIIDQDEERIIQGALTFSEMQTRDIMIGRKEAFYLDMNTKITKECIEVIKSKGFSRVPLYNAETRGIEGILYVIDLIGITPSNKIKAKDFMSSKKLIKIGETMWLDNALNLLIHHKMHMAIVVNSEDEFIGLLTLEDIMEEILKAELEEHED